MSKALFVSALCASLVLSSVPVNAQETVQPSAEPVVQAETPSAEVEIRYPRLSASAELGFLSVLSHTVQLSQNNTVFDYRRDGGQDTLFTVSKWMLDLELDPHHSVSFLYQPLSLSTQVALRDEIRQDNLTFAKGTPMRLLYDFPFFRASYLYDFNTDPFEELAVGASLQLRDAVIEFAPLNGEQGVFRSNVGPVPVLKFRSRHRINETWWWGSEVDGFYAPVSLLNGSTTNVVGAILDANLRAGFKLNEHIYPYANLRYLAGGGVGTGNEREGQSDGFSDNWLHFLVLTLGVRTTLF